MTEIATNNACGICGKELHNWRTCPPDDPAMDCGGDCLECIQEIETAEPPPSCEFCDSTEDVEEINVSMPQTFTGTLAVCKQCRIKSGRE